MTIKAIKRNTKLKKVIDDLEKLYDYFDNLQETDEAQEDDKVMHEIGEVMGSLDNLCDVIMERGL